MGDNLCTNSGTSGTRKLTFSTLNNAALKGYNVHWLLTGIGEPYIAVSERKNHSEFEQKIDPQLIELYSQLVATKDELIEGMRKTINELRQPKKKFDWLKKSTIPLFEYPFQIYDFSRNQKQI